MSNQKEIELKMQTQNVTISPTEQPTKPSGNRTKPTTQRHQTKHAGETTQGETWRTNNETDTIKTTTPNQTHNQRKGQPTHQQPATHCQATKQEPHKHTGQPREPARPGAKTPNAKDAS